MARMIPLLDGEASLLACPRCEQTLRRTGSSLVCASGHAFDIARQGYVNLLGSKPPANADTADMIAARERFLASGAYDPIAEDVARRLTMVHSVLEVGAGTGFYLSRVLADREGAHGIALDVSVPAAKRAASSHPHVTSVVADVWGRLPLLTGRLGAVLCVFAPRNIPEFTRVLAPGGVFVVVTPNPGHLAGLRQRYGLMHIDDDKDSRLLRACSGHLEAVAQNRIDYTVDGDANLVTNLIAMGPNAFHGLPSEVEGATIDVSVTVSLFRKRADEVS